MTRAKSSPCSRSTRRSAAGMWPWRLLTEVAQLDWRTAAPSPHAATRHRPRRAGRRARSPDGSVVPARPSPRARRLRLRVATDRVLGREPDRLAPRAAPGSASPLRRPRRPRTPDAGPAGGPASSAPCTRPTPLPRPWSRIATTMSSPLSSGWPTSISQSHPSRRHCSLKIRRRLAGQPKRKARTLVGNRSYVASSAGSAGSPATKKAVISAASAEVAEESACAPPRSSCGS